MIYFAVMFLILIIAIWYFDEIMEDIIYSITCSVSSIDGTKRAATIDYIEIIPEGHYRLEVIYGKGDAKYLIAFAIKRKINLLSAFILSFIAIVVIKGHFPSRYFTQGVLERNATEITRPLALAHFDRSLI